MADFIDFNAWRDLAGQSERDALERQTVDFQKQKAEAERLLRVANRDAERARNRELGGANMFSADATGTASTTLSKVGSYGDYLKAKQGAQNAAARIAAGGEGEFGAVRGVMNQQGAYSANSVGELAKLGGLEQRFGSESERAISEGNAGTERLRGMERTKRDATNARQAEGEAAKAQHLAGVYDRWMKGHAQDSNSVYQDVQRYAQQISTGVDDGWKMPERTQAARAANGVDRRGFAVERDAWGTPSRPSGGATTRGGTKY